MRSKGKRMKSNNSRNYELEEEKIDRTDRTSRTNRTSKPKKTKNNGFYKIIVVALFVLIVAFVINTAPNFIRDKLSTKTRVIINNSNVTASLKKDVIVDDSQNIYLSMQDVKNFFDENITFDKKYNQIITSSDTKLATLELDKELMYVNGSKVNIYATIKEQDDTYYLPFSELKDVYNVDIKYSKEKNLITIDSLDREQKMANSAKTAGVKYLPTTFSKNVDKVKKGDSVVIIEQKDGWYKVRTQNGEIGYLKDVANIYNVRENFEKEKQIEGKVSMVWDYFTNTAPARTEKIKGVNVVSPSFVSIIKEGQGKILTRIGPAGKAYVQWAHNNGYKVWTIVSNDSLGETTSTILNDYKLRETLINNIINVVLENDLDGVNIDFENMKIEDKDMFSQFLIELKPRLAEYSKVLSVDVTAPDGGTNWSDSFDRNKIGKVADYEVFMAYDQTSASSNKAGTTAGADWIEVNLKKFVGTQEEVQSDKIILGMPFYTVLWKSGGTSSIVFIKNIDSTLPSGVEKKWDDSLKQNYAEYQSGGTTYKMWIEDERSLKAKFDLMHEYKLGGAAYWQKDFESSNIWELVETEINK